MVCERWCMWRASAGWCFALDSESGEQLWTRQIKYRIQPGKGRLSRDVFCVPDGITATPVIDKNSNLIYLIGADGALYGLDLGSGEIRYGPVQFVASYAKAWSLSLVDGMLYTDAFARLWRGAFGFFMGVDVRGPASSGDSSTAAFEFGHGGDLGARRSGDWRQRANLWIDGGRAF